MSNCVAYGCTNRTGSIAKAKGITFHVFPHRETEKLKRWVQNVQRENWTPSKVSKLCSQHFKEEYIDRTGQTVRLRENAEPTIFNFEKYTSKRKKKAPNATSSSAVSPKKSARRKQRTPRRLPKLADSPPVGESQEQTSCLKKAPVPRGALNLTDSAPVEELATAPQQAGSHTPQAPKTLNLTNSSSSVVEGTTPHTESSTPLREVEEVKNRVEDQQIEKKNNCGEDHAYALMDSPTTLKRNWNRALDALAICRKKLKVEQQKTRRLRKKVASLNAELDALRGQNPESSNSAEMPESFNFDIPEEVFEELLNIQV